MGRTEAITLCGALLATLLATACAAEPVAANAAPPSTQDPGAAQPGAIPAQLPEPPDTTPSPWVEHAVEESMGATCVTVDERHDHGQYDLLLDDYCLGPAPAHLARVVLSLPAAEIGLSLEQRQAALRDRLPYAATPGLGRRPDFLLGIGKFWIRSFEASDPRDTVYLVFPVPCGIAAGDACYYFDGILAYRLDTEGRPVNVTTRVLPPKPVPTLSEQQRYARHGGATVFLDASKLRFVPAMRWLMEFDPDTPIPDSDPRQYRNWSSAHFGFVVWNGQYFDLRRQIPASLWPCRPVPSGVTPCSWGDDDGVGPFVVETDDAGVAAAAPNATTGAPAPPEAPPKPWVEYAIEEAMGAHCPHLGKDEHGDRTDTEGAEEAVLHGACIGRIPSHVANFLSALGTGTLHLNHAELQELLEADEVRYRAIPGRGDRPDFLVEGNLLWVRTIETADPSQTTYLIQAPFDCGASRPAAEGSPDPGCALPEWTTKAFRVVAGKAPEDVTDLVLPKPPRLTAQERARYIPHLVDEGVPSARVVAPWLDTSRLQQVPTLRWILGFEPYNDLPASDPRAFGDPPLAHFGFLVWTGARYEARETVSRSVWPCIPVPAGSPPCSDARDVQDPFINQP